jgi:anti-sigma B factor antagonist
MDTASGFRVDTVSSGSMVILALYGELDISVQSPLMAEVDRVMQQRPLVLAIDLRGLTSMDSGGVQVLISAGRRSERDGQRFFIIREAPAIDRLLNACGLDGYFELVASPDQLPDGELVPGTGR